MEEVKHVLVVVVVVVAATAEKYYLKEVEKVMLMKATMEFQMEQLSVTMEKK